jgi:hypothetical protein
LTQLYAAAQPLARAIAGVTGHSLQAFENLHDFFAADTVT